MLVFSRNLNVNPVIIMGIGRHKPVPPISFAGSQNRIRLFVSRCLSVGRKILINTNSQIFSGHSEGRTFHQYLCFQTVQRVLKGTEIRRRGRLRNSSAWYMRYLIGGLTLVIFVLYYNLTSFMKVSLHYLNSEQYLSCYQTTGQID